MPLYGYQAAEAGGRIVKGTLSAENREKLLDTLRKEHLTPITVSEAGLASREININIFSKKPKARDLAVFCRQFVSILSSGVTVISALEMLTEQTENHRLRAALADTKRSIETGQSLGEAMHAHADVFSEMFVTLVTAGEASGSLENSFSRMAVQFEKDAKVSGMIKRASIYPAIVCVVAVIVIMAMLTFVIPTFQSMFDELGGELPGLTKMVIKASEFTQNYWLFIFLFFGLLVFGLRSFKTTPVGKKTFSAIALKLPLVKKLSVKSACSRFARTLSTLMGAGLPMIEAIEITSSTMTNTYFREALLEAKDSVAVGTPLSEPLQTAGIFPPLVCHMVKIGEETGGIDDMLNKLADYYDEEVELATQALMSALEPLIIVLLALIVGTIVLSVIMPMGSMYGSLENL
ncbi:MAG TPA: type II secretion system F family protein [Candidatus Acidoferrum sp.]|nr:type II secretion system F family protein [Candidatus Acidoferrum sp.]